VGQERLGPSYFFISLVLGPLNSLVWYVPSLRYTRGVGWRIHCGVEVTESSTNKQHISSPRMARWVRGDLCVCVGHAAGRSIKFVPQQKPAGALTELIGLLSVWLFNHPCPLVGRLQRDRHGVVV
jgi:hypothetical protein